MKRLVYILLFSILILSGCGKENNVSISKEAEGGELKRPVLMLSKEDPGKTCEPDLLYPTVSEGRPFEAGIDDEAFELLSKIIESDIKYGFSSAEVCVIKDSLMVCNNGYGRTSAYNSDLSPKSDAVLVNKDTMYDIASLTKMYCTNFCIEKLVSDGLLDINDKISDILGSEFYEDTIEISYAGYDNPGLETNIEWKKKLTVRNLLSHNAGFPADPKYECEHVDARTQKHSGTDNILFSGNDGSDLTRLLTYESICKTPLMYEPGTKTLYSDVDFMLLGFVVERLTGMRLDEYFDEYFVKPLKLLRTSFNPLKSGFSVSDCAATELCGNTREGTVFFGNIRKNTVWGEVHDEKAYYAMGGVSGHAGLFSTAKELGILSMLMLNGGYENIEFFSKDVINMFLEPDSAESPDWGLGWYLQGDNLRDNFFSEYAPKETFGHQGWTGTLSLIDPVNNLIIVYLTNRVNTPMTSKSSNSGSFGGLSYLSAELSIPARLVYLSMQYDNDALSDVYENLLIEEFNEHLKAASKAGDPDSFRVRALYSILDVIVSRSVESGNEAYIEAAKACISSLKSNRDSAFIERMNARIDHMK